MRRRRPALLLLLFLLGLARPEATVAAADPDADPVDVVVVGAGVAGLVTAWELERQGLETVVLEARPVVGGRAATMEYEGGLRAEAGLQEIWHDSPLVRIAGALGLALETEAAPTAWSSVEIDERVFPLVGTSLRAHLDSFLSVPERERLEAWLAHARERLARAKSVGLADPEVAALQAISLADWVQRDAMLSPRAESWLRLHVECELAAGWEEVSALYALLDLAFLLGESQTYHSVVGGNGRLLEALARASRDVRLSARVTAVRVEADGAARVHYEQNGRVASIRARRVVLAIPFYRVSQLQLEPALTPEHEAALGSLGFGQYATVHLVLGPDPTPATQGGLDLSDVLLTPGPLGVIYSASEPAGDGRRIVSLLVHGAQARAFHAASRTARIDALLDALAHRDPALRERVVETHVYTYHPAAIATWRPGRSPLDAGSELLRRAYGPIHFAGDYTEGGHSDGAAKSGLRVAAAIARALREDVVAPSSPGRDAADARGVAAGPVR
ncbi:MAG: FAD-dependent oxidoreductase [Spirochaetaceae bacterium]|nr:FAD-dependent oxidoreductase [Myxococcales bacterium]MCB9725717.1 FAD-dependent oxidoreductase [Spirochaetaceae bacterium]